MKLTVNVSRSENGGPGSPAQLSTASTGSAMDATAASIDCSSVKSQLTYRATGADTGLMSRPITSAPTSHRISAAAPPIPCAAPVTTTVLPSYCSGSCITSFLQTSMGTRAGPRTVDVLTNSTLARSTCHTG